MINARLLLLALFTLIATWGLLKPEEAVASLTEPERLEYSRRIRVALARQYAEKGDILNWGRALFPDKFALPFCAEMHDYLVDTRHEKFTGTEAPRSHSKTTIRCFLVPIYQALVEPKSFRHYLNVQATGSKALAVNISIRSEIEENSELREIYGNLVSSEKWTDQQYVLKNGVVFTAIGAGQSIRGINYRNMRPDYVMVDDLYDEEDIENINSTKKKNKWFWSSLWPAKSKSSQCSVHVQGTAINDADLLRELQSKKGVQCKTFKAIKEYGTEQARALWPQLNTIEELEEDRELMGSVIWYREMQNERRDDSTSIVKSSWLQGWEIDAAKYIAETKPQIMGKILGFDPSIGQKVSNNPSAATLTLRVKPKDTDSILYIIMGLWEARLSLNERIELLQQIDKSQPENSRITEVRIEAVAGFKDFAAEAIRRTSLPIRTIDHVKDKITNLTNKSYNFENARVKIDVNVDKALRDKLVYQLTTNHPQEDDIRDSVLLTMDESKKLARWRPIA